MAVMLQTMFGAFLIACGVAIMIVSLATSYWMEVTVGGIDYHAGLFEYCDPNDCTDFEDSAVTVDENLEIIQALCVLACVLYFLGFMAAVVTCCFLSSSSSKTVGIICLVLCVLGVIFDVAGVLFYTQVVDDNETLVTVNAGTAGELTLLTDGLDHENDFSFHLAWGAVLPVLLGTTIVFISTLCARKDDEKGYLEPYQESYMEQPPAMDMFGNTHREERMMEVMPPRPMYLPTPIERPVPVPALVYPVPTSVERPVPRLGPIVHTPSELYVDRPQVLSVPVQQPLAMRSSQRFPSRALPAPPLAITDGLESRLRNDDDLYNHFNRGFYDTQLPERDDRDAPMQYFDYN